MKHIMVIAQLVLFSMNCFSPQHYCLEEVYVEEMCFENIFIMSNHASELTTEEYQRQLSIVTVFCLAEIENENECKKKSNIPYIPGGI